MKNILFADRMIISREDNDHHIYSHDGKKYKVLSQCRAG